MSELLLATQNSSKLSEFQSIVARLLPELKILGLKDLQIKEEAPENGRSYFENALNKAHFYCRFYQGVIVAEDSGLEVEALAGAPGIFSARFAGPGSTAGDNISRLLQLMREISNRRAKFIACYVLFKSGKYVNSFYGEVQGFITSQPCGENGFGYDPVFYYPPADKTFAGLSAEEKNLVSHRADAVRKLINYLKEEDLWS